MEVKGRDKRRRGREKGGGKNGNEGREGIREKGSCGVRKG